MKNLLKTALLATSLSALLISPVMARRGADDPVGHVRQEDRQADRATEVRSSEVADRPSASRADVRREDRQADRRADRRTDRRADRAPRN